MTRKRLAAVVAVLLGIFLAASFALQHYVSRLAAAKLDQLVTRVAILAGVTYDRVTVDLIGLRARIRNLVITPVGTARTLQIREVVVRDLDGQGLVPTRLHVELRGIRQGAEDAGVGIFDLRQLGYGQETSGNMEVIYRYDPRGRDFELTSLRYEAEGLGAWTLKGRVGNLDLSGLEGEALGVTPLSLPKAIGRLEQATIYSVVLTYRDDSLVPRVLQSYADRSGCTPGQVRDELIRRLKGRLGSESEAPVREAFEAVESFLRKPGSLSVSLEPRKPVPVAGVRAASPADVAAILNLRVQSSPASSAGRGLAEPPTTPPGLDAHRGRGSGETACVDWQWPWR